MDRVWLWPNLLSLDAPIVALLWQILFARCFHARVGFLPSLLLVLAVWLIYAADRTLDAWSGSAAQPRHEFYRRHWRALLPFWILALAAGSILAGRLVILVSHNPQQVRRLAHTRLVLAGRGQAPTFESIAA